MKTEQSNFVFVGWALGGKYPVNEDIEYGILGSLFKTAIRESGIKICGFDHQLYENKGIEPIFKDENGNLFSLGMVSYRTWGRFMAEVYNIVDIREDKIEDLVDPAYTPRVTGMDFGYCHWAWTPPEKGDSIFPKFI